MDKEMSVFEFCDLIRSKREWVVPDSYSELLLAVSKTAFWILCDRKIQGVSVRVRNNRIFMINCHAKRLICEIGVTTEPLEIILLNRKGIIPGSESLMNLIADAARFDKAKRRQRLLNNFNQGRRPNGITQTNNQ